MNSHFSKGSNCGNTVIAHLDIQAEAATERHGWGWVTCSVSEETGRRLQISSTQASHGESSRTQGRSVIYLLSEAVSISGWSLPHAWSSFPQPSSAGIPGSQHHAWPLDHFLGRSSASTHHDLQTLLLTNRESMKMLVGCLRLGLNCFKGSIQKFWVYSPKQKDSNKTLNSKKNEACDFRQHA